jgi:hypothetical protein
MREQSYLDRAKLNPARTFKTPMDVVETGDIDATKSDLIVYGFPRSTFVNVARCSSSRIRSAIHQGASRSSAHE